MKENVHLFSDSPSPSPFYIFLLDSPLPHYTIMRLTPPPYVFFMVFASIFNTKVPCKTLPPPLHIFFSDPPPGPPPLHNYRLDPPSLHFQKSLPPPVSF